MDLARFVVDAVVLEGRSYRDVAASHGVSKSWVAKLVLRYRQGGYDAIKPRSKANHKVANRTSDEIEDKVVRLRKELVDAGFDGGAQTIHFHLSKSVETPPSVSTIWRILRRRGFVTRSLISVRGAPTYVSRRAFRTRPGRPTSPSSS